MSVVGTITIQGAKVTEDSETFGGAQSRCLQPRSRHRHPPRTQRRRYGGHGKRTPRRRGLETVLELLSFFTGAESDNETGHTIGNTLELASCLLAIGELGTLVDGFEGLEVEEYDSSTRVGRVAESGGGGGIDSVLISGSEAARRMALPAEKGP